MHLLKNRFLICVIVSLLLVVSPISAGDTVLSNNAGSGNNTFFIDGEQSLVMNGFDLAALGITLPTTLDAVSISVDTPVPTLSVEVVIYQDGNGGSPVDATLVARQTVTIATSGTARIVLDTPASITEPVVWVGFYLPVGFVFNADTSGSSVLTYWAWTPNSTFDLANLSSASVLGPADGSAPVNINLNGIARITAELQTSATTSTTVTSGDGTIGNQVVSNATVDTSILENYFYCGPVFFDPQDIGITAGGRFDLTCRADIPRVSPGTIRQPVNLRRAGFLFDIAAYGDYTRDPNDRELLPIPVTHCIRPQDGDLENSVIGVAFGSPRSWEILPTVRYGDLICAEVTHSGNLSYFLPDDDSNPPLNVNLAFGDVTIEPHPLECGLPAGYQILVRNTGFEWFSVPDNRVKVLVENIHVRTGIITGAIEYHFEPLGPGQSIELVAREFIVDEFLNELHRLVFTIDYDNQVNEQDETDNVFITDYILVVNKDLGACAPRPS